MIRRRRWHAVSALLPPSSRVSTGGKEPLYSPASCLPSGFDDLFSMAAADKLAERVLRRPFIRMAKDGAVLPAERFTAQMLGSRVFGKPLERT